MRVVVKHKVYTRLSPSWKPQGTPQRHASKLLEPPGPNGWLFQKTAKTSSQAAWCIRSKVSRGPTTPGFNFVHWRTTRTKLQISRPPCSLTASLETGASSLCSVWKYWSEIHKVLVAVLVHIVVLLSVLVGVEVVGLAVVVMAVVVVESLQL